jgi:hypothetical protein
MNPNPVQSLKPLATGRAVVVVVALVASVLPDRFTVFLRVVEAKPHLCLKSFATGRTLVVEIQLLPFPLLDSHSMLGLVVGS